MTKQERAKHYEAERKKFERWMKRYWDGISLRRERVFDDVYDEYRGGDAQCAWEVWQKFNGVK